MFIAEHPKNNTLYCMHGRHGTQSFVRFVNTRPDFRQLSDQEVTLDHLKGKFRVITRNPMEKFQSGLSWYVGYIFTNSPQNQPELASAYYDSDTFRMIFHAMMLSGATMGNFESNHRVWTQNTDLANYIDVDIKKHFKYHLGEAHMAFSNLSLVLLVALGLDIEVFDVEDIDLLYKDFGFVDSGTNDQGKYQQSEDKKKYYSAITEIYMDTLETLCQEQWLPHCNPSKAEFSELMDMEIRAYNALKSDHMLEDCRSFLLDLIKGILYPKSKNTKTVIEILYMMQTIGTTNLVSRLMNLIPYKSDMYHVVGLLTNMGNSFVPGTWQDHLQGCKNLLNNQ